MLTEPPEQPASYLRAILLDGATPFRYRSRIHTLLGSVPAEDGAMTPAPTLNALAFPFPDLLPMAATESQPDSGELSGGPAIEELEALDGISSPMPTTSQSGRYAPQALRAAAEGGGNEESRTRAQAGDVSDTFAPTPSSGFPLPARALGLPADARQDSGPPSNPSELPHTAKSSDAGAVQPDGTIIVPSATVAQSAPPGLESERARWQPDAEGMPSAQTVALPKVSFESMSRPTNRPTASSGASTNDSTMNRTPPTVEIPNAAAPSSTVSSSTLTPQPADNARAEQAADRVLPKPETGKERQKNPPRVERAGQASVASTAQIETGDRPRAEPIARGDVPTSAASGALRPATKARNDASGRADAPQQGAAPPKRLELVSTPPGSAAGEWQTAADQRLVPERTRERKRTSEAASNKSSAQEPVREALPPVQQAAPEIIVVRQRPEPTRTRYAFWERSYLRRVRARILR